MTGYCPSPWPGEDGGPRRLQTPDSVLTPGALTATTRATQMSTMTVLGDPGEVFLLTHSALRANLGLPTTSRVERIDPLTLKPIATSPRLPGGPMWPGGMAIHRNGDLYVVYGRWAHRLDRQCRLKASLQLPVNAAYNSFVILDCGLIVAKNLSETSPARLIVIDPETLTAVAEIAAPEASIARLSASGDSVYLVGVRSIMRFHWNGATLAPDPDWQWDYLAGNPNSHGWDVVLTGSDAWFMDNGRHRYRTSMIGRGCVNTANRLLRVSLADANDHDSVAISGIPGGSITNPPLIDTARGIAIAYDSANRVLAAFRTTDLAPLWRRDGIGAASHMLLFAERGEIVTNDFGRGGEWLVVLDIATGTELRRVRIGGLLQGVVFPSPGWNDDLYWCSMTKVARVFAG